MKIELTGKEILQFQYILPIQGSLKTLELVDEILKAVKIDDIKAIDSFSKEIEFKDEHIQLIQNMIDILDKNQTLNFQSLSLVKKFLNIKE